MNKLFFAAALTLFCLACNKPAAQNDLTEYGYKGQVQQIIYKKYRQPVTSANNWQVTDTGSYSVNIQVFNKQGNWDSLISWLTMEGSPQMPSMQVYHYTNGVKTGWARYDIGGKTKDSSVISPKNQDSYTEKIYSDNMLVADYQYHINADFNIDKLSYKYYQEDSVYGSFEIIYTRSKPGPAEMAVRRNLLDNTSDTTRYQVLQKDKEGNPTKTLIIQQNDTFLSERQYLYYK